MTRWIAASGRFTSLRERNFSLFLGAYLASLLGSQIFVTIRPFLVFQIAADASALALVLGAYSVAQGLFLLFAGSLLDRFGPRRLLVGADLISFAIHVVLITTYAMGSLSLSLLVVVSGITGVMAAVAMPGARASLGSLVPRDLMSSAVAVRRLARQLAVIVGPPLAGALAPIIGIGASIGIDAASFLLSAILLAVALPVKTANRAEPNMGSGLGVGLHYLIGRPWLRDSMAFTATTDIFFAGAVTLVLPILAARAGWGVLGYGILSAAEAVGAVAGAVFGAKAGGAGYTVRRNGVFTACQGGLVLCVAAAPTLPGSAGVVAASAAMVAFGFTVSWIALKYETVLQTLIPAGLIGRLFSIDQLGSVVAAPVGFAVTGLLIGSVGDQVTMGLWGVVLVGLGLGMVVLASVRRAAYRIPEPSGPECGQVITSEKGLHQE